MKENQQNKLSENSHAHTGEKADVVETYKEEGILTVEALDIATHDAMSKDHKHRSHKRLTLSTPVSVIIGSCIIALSIVAYGFIVRSATPSSPKTMFAGRAVDQADYIEGKSNSDVVVIEYSDPECPFCVQLHPVMKQLRTEYENRIAFVYRYFPLTQIHPHAFDESRAIACAGTIGGEKKFYEYIDVLFDYKTSNGTTQLTKTGKEDFARNIGLESKAFNDCMNNPNIGDMINASLNDGVTAGVQGTPSTFILHKTKKGYEVVSMVDGARPYSYLKAAVDEALSR